MQTFKNRKSLQSGTRLFREYFAMSFSIKLCRKYEIIGQEHNLVQTAIEGTYGFLDTYHVCPMAETKDIALGTMDGMNKRGRTHRD